mmetsp:Transcript_41550/g.109657  ORF Transcript_41550/g.109657 Transcript_41550/m.109657 type:complete len:525 (-) Transcript_41550:114-1688(-)
MPCLCIVRDFVAGCQRLIVPQRCLHQLLGVASWHRNDRRHDVAPISTLLLVGLRVVLSVIIVAHRGPEVPGDELADHVHGLPKELHIFADLRVRDQVWRAEGVLLLQDPEDGLHELPRLQPARRLEVQTAPEPRHRILVIVQRVQLGLHELPVDRLDLGAVLHHRRRGVRRQPRLDEQLLLRDRVLRTLQLAQRTLDGDAHVLEGFQRGRNVPPPEEDDDHHVRRGPHMYLPAGPLRQIVREVHLLRVAAVPDDQHAAVRRRYVLLLLHGEPADVVQPSPLVLHDGLLLPNLERECHVPRLVVVGWDGAAVHAHGLVLVASPLAGPMIPMPLDEEGVAFVPHLLVEPERPHAQLVGWRRCPELPLRARQRPHLVDSPGHIRLPSHLQVVGKLFAVLAVDVKLFALPVGRAVLVQVNEKVRAVVLVLDYRQDAGVEDLPRVIGGVHPPQVPTHEEDGVLSNAEEDLRPQVFHLALLLSWFLPRRCFRPEGDWRRRQRHELNVAQFPRLGAHADRLERHVVGRHGA